jgi:hypothetical protein
VRVGCLWQEFNRLFLQKVEECFGAGAGDAGDSLARSVNNYHVMY